MRALIYASVASMIMQFNMENIRLLLKNGYEVDVACNMEYGSTVSSNQISEMKKQLKDLGVNVYHIQIPRKISAVSDIINSFKSTKQLINERNYSLIHCHSPIGGIICRLGNRFSADYGNSKMIYTAHGFHFYKGAPLKNWLLYYSAEKLCAHFTDVLITINNEDYELANHMLKAKEVRYISGVGIDTKRFSDCNINRAEKRMELGISEDAVLLASVGELNKNKNHEVVIKALARLNNPKIHYIIAGKGELDEYLNKLIKSLWLEKNVHLLGYRSDIAELYKVADIYCHPSIREGLPVAVIEAMAAGLPIICSDIRGNRDLVDDHNGILLKSIDEESFASSVKELINDKDKLSTYSECSIKKANLYDKSKISDIMKEIYISGEF